jgi:hypothetical protein
LISLLAINGLRISEALGADIDVLGLERGHRTLTVLREGDKTSLSRWHRVPPGPSISPSANASTALSRRAASGVGAKSFGADAQHGDDAADQGDDRCEEQGEVQAAGERRFGGS